MKGERRRGGEESGRGRGERAGAGTGTDTGTGERREGVRA